MTTLAFRPRSASELVDAAFQLLRRDYLKYVTLIGIAYLPWLAILPSVTTVMAAPDAPIAPATIALMVALFVAFMALYYGVIKAAILVGASDAYLGGAMDVGSALRRALPRFWPVLWSAILKGLAIFTTTMLVIIVAALGRVVGLGALLLVVAIPGAIAAALHLAVRFAGVPATVVVERLGAVNGLIRSSELTRGHRWHVLKALALVWVIFIVVSMIASMITVLVPSQPLVGQLVGAVISILAYPLIPITETLLYYDLRIRKEGYDIELLAQQVGQRPVEQPAY